MMNSRFRVVRLACLLTVLVLLPASSSGEPESQPRLYVMTRLPDVPRARATDPDAARRFADALREQFDLLDRHPRLQVGLPGTARYMDVAELYPQLFDRLRDYVRQNRWHPIGAALDALDANMASPESLFRQILYGNDFLESTLDTRADELLLAYEWGGYSPAMPTIAAHAGLSGITIEGSADLLARNLPADIGLWEGIDGTKIPVVFRLADNIEPTGGDLTRDAQRLKLVGDAVASGGLPLVLARLNVDSGNAIPDDDTVRRLLESLQSDGPLKIIQASPGRIFRDMEPPDTEWPCVRGDLLTPTRGSAGLTADAAMKSLNRRNEQMAAAAEAAAVAAEWVGGSTYPRERLREHWLRFLRHQSPYDPGRSASQEADSVAWSDEWLSLSGLADHVRGALSGVARALDTSAQGAAILVYNPLATRRIDVVEISVAIPLGEGRFPRVYDAPGNEVPSQYLGTRGGKADVLFLADVAPVSFTVFDVRTSEEPSKQATDLRASENLLENDRLRVSIDADGNLASIVDRRNDANALAAPVRLAMFDLPLHDPGTRELLPADLRVPPRAEFGSPARIKLIESGPVRATLEITRTQGGSTLRQRVQLAAGSAGDHLVVRNDLDWQTPGTLLKAVFPLTATADRATCDLGFGTAGRGSPNAGQGEFPARQWIDLADDGGAFGLAVLSDVKCGWDKPDDHTLRLSLVHAPRGSYLDFGWQSFTYALMPHGGDWREAGVASRAAGLNQPLYAVRTNRHGGKLNAKELSLLSTSSPQIAVHALKKAEHSEEIVVRVQESWGRPLKGGRVVFSSDIIAARETDALERGDAPARTVGKAILFDLDPYQPRTFALSLAPPPEQTHTPAGRGSILLYDADVVSADDDMADGDLGNGRAWPAEYFPPRIRLHDAFYEMGATAPGAPNAMRCTGQEFRIPAGQFDKFYLLAASIGGPVDATVEVGGLRQTATFQDLQALRGQACRLPVTDGIVERDAPLPAYFHKGRLAAITPHLHDSLAGQNLPYTRGCIYEYGFDVQYGATYAVLPNDPRLLVFADAAIFDPSDLVQPAAPFFDQPIGVTFQPAGGLIVQPCDMTMAPTDPHAVVRYTLDGSMPDESSPVYAEPLTIRETTLLRARAERDGRLERWDTRQRYVMATPKPAVDLEVAGPGADVTTYNGNWTSPPDTAGLTPTGHGQADGITLAAAPAPDDQSRAVLFETCINVTADGVYAFFTAGDDPSRLWVDDAEVVDNPGPAYAPSISTTIPGAGLAGGRVALASGWHRLRVLALDPGSERRLHVSWSGPGFARQDLPGDRLFREIRSPRP